MQKINFQNLPNTTTPVTASNLNDLQDNVEDAIDEIIDSGSNLNGNYIKYADGTMIQWNKLQVSDQAISNEYGSLYQGSRSITFPIPFVGDLPTVQCSEFQYGSSASWGCIVGNSTTLTSTVLRGFDAYLRNTGTLCNISWIAIGKWK